MLTAFALLAIPTGAAAAIVNIPPGVSGANQYAETLPGPGGNQRTDHRDTPAPAKALGKKNAAKLEAMGPEGQAAAELAAESAPTTHPANSGRSGSGKTGGGQRASGTSDSGSSGLKQVLGQVTGSSSDEGMGVLLPLLIASSVILGGIFVFNRRRTTHPRD
jgi:hypothetical protein